MRLILRIPTGLSCHALSAIGAVALGSLLSLLNSTLAQACERDGTAATAGEAAQNGRVPAVMSSRRRASAQLAQRAPSRVVAGSQTFKDCDACPEMVVAPAGSFVMGSPDSEPGHNGDEAPQHQVTITKPFAIGKYELTTAEWNACVAETACTGGGTAKPDSDRVPVISISWDEAKAYVAWLSRRTGKKYRLPSEAEWEYAARAGTMSAYHTGSTLHADQANVAPEQAKPAGGGMMSGFGMKPAARQTVPVGRYPPNGFGLHDVHGNVWEWVEDCVNDGYAGAPTDSSAWTTGNCAKRVVRGGSWVDYPVGARSAMRSGLGTGDRGLALGLRVARTLD